MKSRSALLVVAAVLGLLPNVQSKDQVASGAPDLANFSWLSQLTGSCWTGKHPDGVTTDTQCYEVQFGRFIRGTLKVSGPHNGVMETNLEGDSVFAWDAKKKCIVYSLWSNKGGLGSGEAHIEGEIIRFPTPRKEGSTAPESRSSWIRIDADSFKVTREMKDGDVWKEVFSVIYRRVQK